MKPNFSPEQMECLYKAIESTFLYLVLPIILIMAIGFLILWWEARKENENENN